MIDDTLEGVESDMTFADLLVTVLVRGENVHRIVDVDRLQTIESDNTVEFGQHTVEVVDDVVAAVPDVTGIKTNS